MGPISHTFLCNYPAGVTDVTISIVSGGDADLLAACLASIPRAAREITVQIVVVDNRVGGRAGSADGRAGRGRVDP